MLLSNLHDIGGRVYMLFMYRFLLGTEGALSSCGNISYARLFTKDSLERSMFSHHFGVIRCRVRRDWLWIFLGIPHVILRRIIKKKPLYGGYLWDLFGSVIFALGRK